MLLVNVNGPRGGGGGDIALDLALARALGAAVDERSAGRFLLALPGCPTGCPAGSPRRVSLPVPALLPWSPSRSQVLAEAVPCLMR